VRKESVSYLSALTSVQIVKFNKDSMINRRQKSEYRDSAPYKLSHNRNYGIDAVNSGNIKEQLKKVRFVPKLKNCGSSHSIKSLIDVNRSHDLTKDYTKSTNDLENTNSNIDTFSSYNPIGSGIKTNSSMTDFKRNLYKLYQDHNPKSDYEQSISNNAQYLLRRKNNKNQQPRQFQQSMNRSYDRYNLSNATQPINTYLKSNLCYNDDKPRMELVYEDIDNFASKVKNDTAVLSKNYNGDIVEILLLEQNGRSF